MSDSSESSGGEEEISLDDFMDGDFTDPNPGATPAPSPVSSMEDGEISLDDFFDDDTTISKEKETIVCLPNKVVAEVTGSKEKQEFDSIAR